MQRNCTENKQNKLKIAYALIHHTMSKSHLHDTYTQK